MRVKRYVVDSMPDALQLIRSELGKDAVILNTKEIRTSGFLGLFGKRRIEVIAATDTPAQNARSSEWGAAPLASGATAAPLVHKKVEKHEELPNQEAGNAHLLEEIKQMKEMVLRLSRQSAPQAKTYSPAFEAIRERLAAHEILSEIVDEWLEKAEQVVAGSDMTDAVAAKEAVKHVMRETLNPGVVEGIREDTRVIHFVGPTGVGKTTTIAKLAAEQVLKRKKKVGFITSDTYRIAAVEQLKTYAMILNVPLEVVFSPLELKRAFESLGDCDLIFMDTAGRNFRNEMYVSELNSLIGGSNRSETYLVLSMTTRYKDMKAIVDNFSRFKLDKVLFTKRDETECLGAPLNLLHEYDVTLSYVSNGQNVPDDIFLIDTEQWIDLLLEEAE